VEEEEKMEKDVEYTTDFVDHLHIIWGTGFLSPGGASEVARALKGVPVRGRTVLDIGCGTGGIDVLLVKQHGAEHVTAIDVEQPVLDRAIERASEEGLAEHIEFELIAPGALPFQDTSFDIVFSKDAVIHVEDKPLLFAEAFRVLCPSGQLAVGDWFRSEDELSPEMIDWMGGAPDFNMGTLQDLVTNVNSAGFVDVEFEDRTPWFREYTKSEVGRIKGPIWNQLVERFDEERAAHCLERAEFRALLANQGQLRPGFVRARRPS
jgi:phosphoethanolamine N-methyltransferase